MAFLWAAIRIVSVSLLRFSFRSHDHVFSWEISTVCRLKYSYIIIIISFNWLLFAEIWKPATFLRYSGLFKVSQLIFRMLWSKRFLFILIFSPSLFHNPLLLFQKQQQQLVLLSPSCSSTFLNLKQYPDIYWSFCSLSFLFYICRNGKIPKMTYSFLLVILY